MWFLFPVFLIGALAVAVPILLHLLRRDVAPEVPFTAVRLLRRSPLEQTKRRRLRDWLLLTARIAALLLLAMAFARPYLTAAAEEAPLRIVAIDRSYSMGAPGQFDRALALARGAIDAAGRREQVAVLAFDDRVDVLSAPGSVGDARAALAGLRAGYGATRYAPVVAKAAELAAGAPGVLTVVTDLQRAGWEADGGTPVSANLQLELKDVGAPSANAAVTDVRRTPSGAAAVITNAGTAPLTGTVRLLFEGRVVASAPFTAPSLSSADVTIAYRLPEWGAAAVEIDDPDGYPADNIRYFVLEGEMRGRVIVATGAAPQSGFYLTRVLLAAAADEGLDVATVPAAALGKRAEADLTGSAILLLSTRTLDRRAREIIPAFVRAGGGLFVAAGAEVEPAVVGKLLGSSELSAEAATPGSAALAATDVRHPIFWPFGPLIANLGHVRFERFWRLQPDGWTVVARFTDGSPALVERQHGAGTVLLFASDVDAQWNDFPLQPAFVPFVLEAVRHIAMPLAIRRDVLVAQVPPGIPAEPGVHTRGADGRRIAVNVDPAESSPAQIGTDEFIGMLEPADVPPDSQRLLGAQQAEGQQNLWRYGLLLMLAVLVVESAAGRFR